MKPMMTAVSISGIDKHISAQPFAAPVNVGVQQPPAQTPSRVARHPVLFGVLVGARGGALIGGNAGHPCNEESFCRRAGLIQIGTAAGPGAGALAGLAVAWIR